MRSQDEIVKRFELRKEADMLGFEVTEYIKAMDFDHAKPYLVPEATAESWKVSTKEDILQEAKEYMPFAFEKAEGQRGISANRSIMHYIAWLWLLEEDELLEKVEDAYETNYHDYGIPILNMICAHFHGISMTDSPINLDEAHRMIGEYQANRMKYPGVSAFRSYIDMAYLERIVSELEAGRQRIAELEGTVARKHETARKLGRMYRERGDLIDQISELAAIEGGKP